MEPRDGHARPADRRVRAGPGAGRAMPRRCCSTSAGGSAARRASSPTVPGTCRGRCSWTWTPTSPRRPARRAGTRCRSRPVSRPRCAAPGSATGARWSSTTRRTPPWRRGPGGCCATSGTMTAGSWTAGSAPGRPRAGRWPPGTARCRRRGTSPPGPGRCRCSTPTARPAWPAAGLLLDARARERYRGEAEPIDPVAGHIPGAISAPTTATSARTAASCPRRGCGPGSRRSASARTGPAHPVAAYCGSGVTAAHEVLALEIAGIRASLYAGSWSNWVADPARPVATGPEPG